MEELYIEKIIDTYGPGVYSFAFSKVKNEEDANDIYQNVFYKLFEKKPTFTNSNQLRAWLMKTAYNFAMDVFRKNARECELKEDIGYSQEYDSFNDMLEILPEKYRDTVYLFYAEDMKITDIAKVLGISQSGVKSRLSRAKKMLREELK